MTDLKKYTIRFGAIFLIAAPIVYFTQGASAIRIISYKLCMAAIAVGFVELLWALFFKPVFGKSEELPKDELLAVMLFRGLLYGAVVLAITLGL